MVKKASPSRQGKRSSRGSSSSLGVDAWFRYQAEISSHPILTAEEEQDLARRFRDEGDLDAMHALITSNLRFVVKVTYEYRSYGFRLADLVQEGNIGLMKAVRKFDPDRNIRLITYAVWWIRAYIQSFILRNWSQVRLGTTNAQRTLFFSLARVQRELERMGEEETTDESIAELLRTKPEEVRNMRARLEARDVSLDTPVGEEGTATALDFLSDAAQLSAHDLLEDATRGRLVRDQVARALRCLNPRELYVVKQRVMADPPMPLQDVGKHFGVSRERARQIEVRAKQRLRSILGAYLEIPLEDEEEKK